MDVVSKLFSMKDDKFKKFHEKLIPTVSSDLVIGVRTPELRRFAAVFSKSEESKKFIESLPHIYYEENNLHAFILERIMDYDKLIQKTECFLPYIDNWATCDMFRPKAFVKNHDKLILKITDWMHSDKTYTVRYAIGLLISIYMDENFKSEHLEMVSQIKLEEYYINMMIAWYFATAIAKQYDFAISYITERRLDKWIHNKTIQKASESRRINSKTKDYLKTFKIE